MTVAALARLAAMLGFVALGWAATAAELAPVMGAPGAWPAPDLLFCVAAALAVRRPAATPAALVFLLGLMRDMLGGGPVGLGALALLAGVEGARAAAARGRPLGLMAEWLGAALWAAAASGLVFVGLLVTLAPTPALAELGLRLAATAAAYPLVALALRVGLRGRPAAGSDGDMMFGRRA